ncbi:hypothetical protein BZG02_05700 [Labilibaculum filiforme]|uniref:Curli assembly protein CsgC n=1 Tax=Labilibaculum filiforme TaxID=1940526 RepID=A0A2N3I1Y7_9BACT|nr:curli-like amyloid fiber formation chaperone CsgH [Labilibaculum filiforme]PKQ64310.1 hypothetical protein BZG02_05700 [Labilibaculum filiforme]
MYTKIIFFVAICFIFNAERVMGQLPVKAWVEVGDKMHCQSLKANIENQGEETFSLRYVFELSKKGASGNSNSIQKGSFILLGGTITTLSESGMNLMKSDRLTAKLFIYHDKVIVAQDSVVLHGDNY